ncbi:MAG: DUF3850 domain-containing protein [Candidatus Diapherotrites archaeon]|nr:DUF3850 domain-containing protein [Candidatus Diapherotrites archaeon]
MIVEKKCWPEGFELIRKGEKKYELRLNDFKIGPGDTFLLKEFNPKTKEYTGRKIEKKVLKVDVHDRLFQMYSEKELKEKGIQYIELE